LKELAPGKALARIATQFTEVEGDFGGERCHGEGSFQWGQQSAFFVPIAQTRWRTAGDFPQFENYWLGRTFGL
jgi:hypothetical protein